jgi:N-acetylneuraminic acid mutarotase
MDEARLRRYSRHGATILAAVRVAIVAAMLAAGSAAEVDAQTFPPLPVPVTNAAVASGSIDGVQWIFAALGVDSTKRWPGITRRVHAWSSDTRQWRRLPDVPGPEGRLAASAQIVRGRLFLLGGYTVDSAGHERSLANVDIYDPREREWRRGADIPVAIDDAVVGVYHDSLLYVVSGWHDTNSVQTVQLYDVVRDAWFATTPIPGPGVFGHSGAVSGNTIVFVDGVVKQNGPVKYRLIPQVWIGTIDRKQPTTITWRPGPAHPGAAVYRAASGVCGKRIVFAGGTENPYNYNGIGYDGHPSEPGARVVAFDIRRGVWEEGPALSTPSMDHRGLAMVGDTAWIVGGMRSRQVVSASVDRIALNGCAR